MKKLSVLVAGAAIGLMLVGCRIGASDDDSGSSGSSGDSGTVAHSPEPESKKTTGKARPKVPNESAALTGDSRVPNGNSQTLKGSGFGYGEDVRLTFEGTGSPATTRTADDNGTFEYKLVIRSGPGQEILVHAKGQTSGRSADFSYVLT